ncbi:ATP-grasp domain-containing protein [Phocoenobacter skyensis]|uniref:RimK-like ATP-grasp domain-containing protein n=1 Tax=Phocoenobacter skyensis TaxID=97481 RepID=A0A1H7WIH4_9PAST|nr:hypothetical protein [Pasteurella skyensis]MDP8079226.1 hypothetical protein [Pasteurella skyensis]MDP8085164.1 hypothetical protein [Pasteurella skyensis]MDP8185081.1 hypothetical protein [Pasteurella skyensis]QLB22233.1 hypothetical protein A6B44_03070 [Pasteurella skyensis]SEM20697.1 RimK-like ATP-grasp domain-containing protein [Pasteurella skyensis]
MKIAIHKREGSFSDRWITYCKENNISYIEVNCHLGTILELLLSEKVTHLMWHINHADDIDVQAFSYVMNSADNMGIKTFPNFNARWHFDDKIAQMYFLTSFNQPLVPSYVFFDEKKALETSRSIDYPIVAKLKRGAGATNVKLIHNYNEVSEYIKRMFSIGISPHSAPLGNLKQKVRIAKAIKSPKLLIKKVFGYFYRVISKQNSLGNEKGYFYYQDFLPKNDYDTRIVVVGDKAIGIVRTNRDNDFRASGSGKIVYDINKIDIEMINIAFKLKEKSKYDCLGFDFVYDKDRKPKIIEICFGFSMLAYDKCEGYWDEELHFHKQTLNLQYEMIKNFIA